MHKYIRKHSTHHHHAFVKYQMHIGTTIRAKHNACTEQNVKGQNQNTENKQHFLPNTTCIDETKSPQQKPKSTKQKLNRKNQNRRIIPENKNVNFY